MATAYGRYGGRFLINQLLPLTLVNREATSTTHSWTQSKRVDDTYMIVAERTSYRTHKPYHLKCKRIARSRCYHTKSISRVIFLVRYKMSVDKFGRNESTVKTLKKLYSARRYRAQNDWQRTLWFKITNYEKKEISLKGETKLVSLKYVQDRCVSLPEQSGGCVNIKEVENFAIWLHLSNLQPLSTHTLLYKCL